jgi:hypothetical protein
MGSKEEFITHTHDHGHELLHTHDGLTQHDHMYDHDHEHSHPANAKKHEHDGHEHLDLTGPVFDHKGQHVTLAETEVEDIPIVDVPPVPRSKSGGIFKDDQ